MMKLLLWSDRIGSAGGDAGRVLPTNIVIHRDDLGMAGGGGRMKANPSKSVFGARLSSRPFLSSQSGRR
jgi:hypothetical protein